MITISVTGAGAVQKALQKYTNPTLGKRLQTASRAGADAFKPAMKAEASAVSKRLARSVSSRRASKDKPASVVTFRPKVAFFRHFVIGGTRDHGPRKSPLIVFAAKDGSLVRAKHVRGVRPNPIPQRVFARMRGAAHTAIVASLEKE